MPAAPSDLVADALVICRGERGEGPADHDEPRTASGLYVGHDKQLTAEVVVADLNYLTHGHDPVRSSLGSQPGTGPARAVDRELVPSGDSKADVGLDLIRNVGANSSDGAQRLRDQFELGGTPLTGKAARGDRRRTA